MSKEEKPLTPPPHQHDFPVAAPTKEHMRGGFSDFDEILKKCRVLLDSKSPVGTRHDCTLCNLSVQPAPLPHLSLLVCR